MGWDDVHRMKWYIGTLTSHNKQGSLNIDVYRRKLLKLLSKVELTHFRVQNCLGQAATLIIIHNMHNLLNRETIDTVNNLFQLPFIVQIFIFF